MSGEITKSTNLSEFGYRQQLKRSMGRFSSFAISFSLISIVTGIFANFAFGIEQVGGYLLWSWTVVALGQFLVALVMADLSARFPIAGYGYQWTSRLTNAHFGYFVGWLLLMQFITGFPGVCQALATTFHGLAPVIQGDWAVTLITIIVISLITLVHLYGIKVVSLVNDTGVYAEIIGVLLIIVSFWGLWLLAGQFDFGVLFETGASVSGGEMTFSTFALSLLVGAWCLTGFEAAADLAEETRQPRKNVPRAVILSQVSAAIMGFLMIAAFLLISGDIQVLQSSENPLIGTLELHLGDTITSFIGMIIILSIFACGVACMATATRLVFSLARDNMLPFSGFLKKIHKSSQSPRNATIVVWALGCLFVLLVRQLAIITNISAVAGYIGYCGIMIATIRTSNNYSKVEGFSLGKWRKTTQITALLWTLFVVCALTIPATRLEGMSETHLPAKSTAAALMLGIIVYFFFTRQKILAGEAGPPTISNQSVND